MSQYDPILDEIRRRLVSPPQVLKALGLEAEREGGGSWKICCPWHNERTGSCNVRVGPDGSLQVHCFGCGRGGDVFSLIAGIRGLELPQGFAEVKREAAQMANISLEGAPRFGPSPRPVPLPSRPEAKPVGPPTVAERAFDTGARALLTACPLDFTVGAWFATHGLAAEANRDGWGVLPPAYGKKTGDEARRDSENGYDVEDTSQAGLIGSLIGHGHARHLRWLIKGGRIASADHVLLIPWRSPDGRVNELQRRWAPRGHTGREQPPKGTPKYVFPSRDDYQPQATYAYGVDRAIEIGEAREVWLVEGAIDVLAIRALNAAGRLASNGKQRSLVALGLPGVARWKQVASSVLPHLAGKVVRVALDNDPEPKKGVLEAVEAITQASYVARAVDVRRTLPPEPHKDWADFAAAVFGPVAPAPAREVA